MISYPSGGEGFQPKHATTKPLTNLRGPRGPPLEAPMSSKRPKWFGPTFTANYKPEEPHGTGRLPFERGKGWMRFVVISCTSVKGKKMLVIHDG